MLVIEAPRPVNKSENATTRDLCFNNFLMLREELLLVFCILYFILYNIYLTCFPY